MLLLLLDRYAPVWLAGLLGAGIMAAVMASDSQILALSTMFTEDVFAHYGGKARFGEAAQVHTGRAFVVALTILAYAIALRAPESIFALADPVRLLRFRGASPLLVAALFWRGSTKWGALAVTLWSRRRWSGSRFPGRRPAPPPGPPLWSGRCGGTRGAGADRRAAPVFGFMPVVPMTLVSALLMVVVSRLTPKPVPATLARYFPRDR